AEARAARLWGADWCRFSVAGSTHGNQALALALGSPGQEVIVTRILHRSLLLGLVLAGLRPVWRRPEVGPASGLPGARAVRPARLHRACEATHTTSPTGSIMASIDAARALLAADGERLCGALLENVAAARRRLAAVPGLAVLEGPGVEPAKLVVLLAGSGAHG